MSAEEVIALLARADEGGTALVLAAVDQDQPESGTWTPVRERTGPDHTGIPVRSGHPLTVTGFDRDAIP